MSEKKIESLIRSFEEAVAKRDAEKMLSFFAEDVVWVCPHGTFKGKEEELKRLLTWDVQIIPNVKIRNAGLGIMVKGNKAVHEHVFEGIYEGTKFELLTISVYEFSDEKIQQFRFYEDRLSLAKQLAKGWLQKKIINAVVNRMEKGLH